MKRIRTLGKGGLGIVSLYQANNGQNFAVKQMLYQWDENYYERFKREIEIMATLVHKNIVNVLNFNILNNNFNFENIRVLDLFGGTGSITYEFASRGCENITTVEIFPRCVDFIKKTVQQHQLTGVKIHCHLCCWLG